MKNLSKLIFSAAAMVITGVQCEALEVVYPKNPTVSVNASSTFFVGSTTAGSTLTINSKPVKVWENGSFVEVVTLHDGENDFVLEKVSVDGVIRDTIKKYAKIMIRRHIGINYSGTGQEVYTDGKWLAFMLEQILSNAIKYTPQGVVTIETAEEKDRFFITIKDTGIGIKAEDLPRVFEKGYTGYNGHADKKATGIGLYLCRQMADKLGHTIRMESEIGKGTKVWIGFDLDYADVRD